LTELKQAQSLHPGTDRERPNWRLKSGPDVAAAFTSHRAQTILEALAKGRV